MISAIAVLLATLSLLIMVGALWYVRMRDGINVKAFGSQIQKLIVANNIDRAIRLCNAEPYATCPRWVKTLLTRANRPYSLEFLTHEIWAEHQFLSTKRKFSWSSLLAVAVQLIFFALLYTASMETSVDEYNHQVVLASTGASTVVVICAAISFSSDLITRILHAFYRNYLGESLGLALEVRRYLYARRDYVPPTLMPPRKLTSEEREAWRNDLTEIDKMALETDTPPETLYDDYIVNDTRSPFFRRSD